MTLEILAVGTATPEGSIEQDAASELVRGIMRPGAREERALGAIFRRSGVVRRNSVLLGQGSEPVQDFYTRSEGEHDRGPGTAERMERYARHAGALALQAAGDALQRSGLDAGDISHVVTVSCTGFAAPGFDVELLRDLDLPRTASRTHVGFMGCHGALNGLRVAHAFASDPHARVLLCAAELCSLHLQYGWDEGMIVANALFGDGAAALVLAAPGASSSSGAGRGWSLGASGAVVFPGTEDAMTWTVGDSGFAMTLSARVPNLIEDELRPWMEAWLSGRGTSVDEIRTWAVHPGGPRILDAAEKALGLSRDETAVSREVLAEHGNMSSPTLLFMLERLIERDAPRPCVALGFGPGLAAEAALFV